LYALDEKSIAELSEKYRLPGDYRDLARLVSKYHSVYTSIPDLNSEELLNLLESLDAFRRRKRFNDFLEACQIIYQINNKVASKVKKTLALAQSVDIHAFVKQGLKGVEIKEAIHKARVKLIQQG
jgi:tRNA nucleotidyltransferase (CCA-adding enzyme)